MAGLKWDGIGKMVELEDICNPLLCLLATNHLRLLNLLKHVVSSVVGDVSNVKNFVNRSFCGLSLK